MKKTLSNIISFIYKFILLILITIFAMSLFNFKFYVVPSGSMEPNIHIGSLVLINENIPISDIQIGDVIVYNRRADYNVIHRVIEINNETLKVQGDANPRPDADIINQENFVGKEILVIPALGQILSVLTSVKGKIACIVVLLSLGILDWFLCKDEDCTAKEKNTKNNDNQSS